MKQYKPNPKYPINKCNPNNPFNMSDEQMTTLKMRKPELYKRVALEFGFSEDDENDILDELVKCELNYIRGLITGRECHDVQVEIAMSASLIGWCD